MQRMIDPNLDPISNFQNDQNQENLSSNIYQDDDESILEATDDAQKYLSQTTNTYYIVNPTSQPSSHPLNKNVKTL